MNEVNRKMDQRIVTVFLPDVGFRANFNGFADPASAVVCGFHRLLGPNFGFF